MNLLVKRSNRHGCVFLGKGIKDHPEMGVVVECREVTLDEWDSFSRRWKGNEQKRILFRTDVGYAFDSQALGKIYEIEQYAPNWRASKPDAWGMF